MQRKLDLTLTSNPNLKPKSYKFIQKRTNQQSVALNINILSSALTNLL